jgi:hypothetical protein
LAALRGDARSLTAALRAGIGAVDGRSKATAAAMLLLLQDDAGRDVISTLTPTLGAAGTMSPR